MFTGEPLYTVHTVHDQQIVFTPDFSYFIVMNKLLQGEMLPHV